MRFYRYFTPVEPDMIKLYAVNKPASIKLMDVDMEIFKDALLCKVDTAHNGKLAFMRDGLVGMPAIRPVAASTLIVATTSVAAPAQASMPMFSGVAHSHGAPTYNFAAGSHVTFNVISGSSAAAAIVL